MNDNVKSHICVIGLHMAGIFKSSPVGLSVTSLELLLDLSYVDTLTMHVIMTEPLLALQLKVAEDSSL